MNHQAGRRVAHVLGIVILIAIFITIIGGLLATGDIPICLLFPLFVAMWLVLWYEKRARMREQA